MVEMFKNKLFPLVLFLICAEVSLAADEPLVETSHGWLRGTLQKSYNGRTFSSFEGVPYAQPPIGPLRFEPPQPAENWTGIWVANMKTICIQCYTGPHLGSSGHEDCLYLNIYIPRAQPKSSDNLDVIIHIHGGAWMLGSGDFYAGPDYLMDEDVIFVTLNYRLGAFGFLSTEDLVQPGNNGMKDQVEALRWIKENIRYFGGNPNSITLTGMSAGGASVHYHFLSPLSKGLFHKGISQSGTALNPWAMQEAGLDKAKRLSVLMGCPVENSRQMIDCLKSRNAYQIIEVTKEFMVHDGHPFSPFGPVVEIPHEGAFIQEHPYEMLLKGKVADLPWITSVTEREGIYPAAFFGRIMEMVDKDFDKIAPEVLDYNYTIPESERDALTQLIRQYYFKESANLQDFITMCGDRHFKTDANIAATLQVKHNKSPIYFNIFAYRGQHSFSEIFYGAEDDIGTSHADDVLYYLKTFLADEKLTKTDEDMKSIYLQLITSFARTSLPKINGITWTPLKDDKHLNVLYITNPYEIEMKTVEDLGSRSFWTQLPLKENGNLVVNVITRNEL